MPKSEFYATIKGPNYDNVWITHDGFGDDLAQQIQNKTKMTKAKTFHGMSDDELLHNTGLLREMGLIN